MDLQVDTEQVQKQQETEQEKQELKRIRLQYAQDVLKRRNARKKHEEVKQQQEKEEEEEKQQKEEEGGGGVGDETNHAISIHSTEEFFEYQEPKSGRIFRFGLCLLLLVVYICLVYSFVNYEK